MIERIINEAESKDAFSLSISNKSKIISAVRASVPNLEETATKLKKVGDHTGRLLKRSRSSHEARVIGYMWDQFLGLFGEERLDLYDSFDLEVGYTKKLEIELEAVVDLGREVNQTNVSNRRYLVQQVAGHVGEFQECDTSYTERRNRLESLRTLFATLKPTDDEYAVIKCAIIDEESRVQDCLTEHAVVSELISSKRQIEKNIELQQKEVAFKDCYCQLALAHVGAYRQFLESTRPNFRYLISTQNFGPNLEMVSRSIENFSGDIYNFMTGKSRKVSRQLKSVATVRNIFGVQLEQQQSSVQGQNRDYLGEVGSRIADVRKYIEGGD